jgi:probable rRNA maturation factor
MATTVQGRKVGSGGRMPWLKTLVLRNRQRQQRLDMRLLRRIVQALLGRVCPTDSFDLAIYIVTQAQITHLNETFLRHKGPTDVIAFHYGTEPAPCPSADKQDAPPAAEIFVCLEVALSQARRFHTTWQSELVRYLVHGTLHLLGYTDQDPKLRREMKKVENALLSDLTRQFDLRRLSPA